MSNANIAPKSKKMTVGTLAIMNITAVVSLRFIPSEAEYGLGAIFYYTFAAIMFLVPVAFVAAELATTYPQKGGGISMDRRSIWGSLGFCRNAYDLATSHPLLSNSTDIWCSLGCIY